MNRQFMDLHMHSVISDDGQFTPKELMQMCHDANLQVVAIADHNSAEAIPEASEAAKKLGLTLIPAIELDCVIDGVELHVLGYGINALDPAFAQLTQSLRTQEQAASKIRLQKAKELGLYIDETKAYALSHHNIITGEIIAEVALEDERNHSLMKDYLPNGSRSDNPFVNFYWDYCSQGKPLYAKVNFMSLQEAVDLIYRTDGFAILAHPGNNTKENIALLDAIFEHDIIGMEVYSSYHSPKQIQFYETYAKEHDLLMTCGSDFHGKTKPAISLGAHGCPDSQELYALLKPFLKKKLF